MAPPLIAELLYSLTFSKLPTTTPRFIPPPSLAVLLFNTRFFRLHVNCTPAMVPITLAIPPPLLVATLLLKIQLVAFKLPVPAHIPPPISA